MSVGVLLPQQLLNLDESQNGVNLPVCFCNKKHADVQHFVGVARLHNVLTICWGKSTCQTRNDVLMPFMCLTSNKLSAQQVRKIARRHVGASKRLSTYISGSSALNLLAHCRGIT